MKTLFPVRPIMALVIAGATLLLPGAEAQQASKLKGGYVLSEEGLSPTGQPLVSLARLTFSENGSVIGSRVVQSSNGSSSYGVQGAYLIDSDGTASLSLSTVSADLEGNSQTFTEDYRLIAAPSGDFSLLRTNPGIYTVGKLQPAAATAPKGAYLMIEKAINRPFARIVNINFDGSSSVAGFQIADSKGSTTRTSFKGQTVSQSDGFQMLTLSSETTDENGDTVVLKESYLYLAATEEVQMLRLAGSPVLFTLTH